MRDDEISVDLWNCVVTDLRADEMKWDAMRVGRTGVYNANHVHARGFDN